MFGCMRLCKELFAARRRKQSKGWTSLAKLASSSRNISKNSSNKNSTNRNDKRMRLMILLLLRRRPLLLRLPLPLPLRQRRRRRLLLLPRRGRLLPRRRLTILLIRNTFILKTITIITVIMIIMVITMTIAMIRLAVVIVMNVDVIILVKFYGHSSTEGIILLRALVVAFRAFDASPICTHATTGVAAKSLHLPFPQGHTPRTPSPKSEQLMRKRACCCSFLQPSASAPLRGQVKNGPCNA